MSTPENIFLRRVDEFQRQNPGVNRPNMFGRMPTEKADEAVRDERGGFFSSLVEGASVGALEPLGFLPPVSRFLDGHVGRERAHVGEKVGYALGWLGGSLIPSTGALKVGGYAVRGLKIAGKTEAAVKAIAAADSFADLGLKGNLIRGGVAGALMGAGRDSEDGAGRLRQMAQEAAFFGIGDAVMHPLFRAISGSALDGAAGKATETLIDQADDGIVGSVDGAALMARAQRLLDIAFPDEAALPNTPIAAKKQALQIGLMKMKLPEMAAGETRIIPSMKVGAADLGGILKQLPEIDYEIIPRHIGKITDVADVLIAPKGQLDRRMVDVYKQNLEAHGVGFFPGLRVRWKGADRIILDLTASGDKIWTYKIGSGGLGKSSVGKVAVPIEELVFLPTGAFTKGTENLPNAAGRWISFIKEFGELPDNYPQALATYIEREGLDAVQATELSEYFAARQAEHLAYVDEALGKSLGALRSHRPGKHPDGALAEMGAQTGYVVEHSVGPDPENPGKLVTVVRDVRNGNATTFSTDDAAMAYMKNNPLELPDITEGIAAPIDPNRLGLSGVSVMPAHSAATLANVNIPWPMASITFPLAERLLPRMSFLRMMDDLLLDQGIKTDIFGTFSMLQQRILLARDMREPWIERLAGYRTKGVRQDSYILMREGLLQKDTHLQSLLAQGKLNQEEFDAAMNIKNYMRDLIGDINANSSGAPLNADEFMHEYLPYIITRPEDTWKAELEAAFKARGKRVNKAMLKFTEEMERAGINPGRLEHNPYMIALRWTTATFTKRHVDEAFIAAKDLLETLPTEGVGDVIRRSFNDAIKVAYGGSPEAYYVSRVAADQYFKNLGIKLESRDFDRVVSSLVSMNYGAFMAFRPALAMRNLTQTLITTLPMIQDPKHMAAGFRAGFTTAGRDEAFRALAIARRSLAAPFEDQLQRDALYGVLGKMSKNPTAARMLQFLTKGQELAHVGLGGEVKIGRFNIPTGLYGRADEMNRAVAYHAQKSKTVEALQKWLGTSEAKGHMNIKRFNEESGLSMFGPSTTDEFHKLFQLQGKDEAIRWISVQMANETQWVYQMGAGPAAFSQGMGRLFGMFGTWPSWYAAHLIRGATRGTATQKARFWGWTAAVTGSFSAASYATGINLAKWSPLSSMTWTGGPALDWFADWRDIVSGASPPGQPPTAKRALALGERGIQDTGQRVPVPVAGYFDPRKGMGLDVVDPARMGKDLLYLFTPGAAQVRDVIRAAEEPDAISAAKRAAGFQPIPREQTTVGRILRGEAFGPVAGSSWPRIQIR